jgi:hypothetical protein
MPIMRPAPFYARRLNKSLKPTSNRNSDPVLRRVVRVGPSHSVPLL